MYELQQRDIKVVFFKLLLVVDFFWIIQMNKGMISDLDCLWRKHFQV